MSEDPNAVTQMWMMQEEIDRLRAELAAANRRVEAYGNVVEQWTVDVTGDKSKLNMFNQWLEAELKKIEEKK